MIADVTHIAIMGESVDARHEEIHIERLFFLPDNPRVYAVIRDMEDFDELTPEEKQERIYESMLKESSVKNLRPEIQRDGGLQEPIIVRYDTHQVIEGNSRLAVYRELHQKNPDDEKWKSIRCLVVSSLTDDQQTRLLGQIHLHGKTEWTPYAKALFCWRWVREQGKEVKDLAKLSGFTQDTIKKHAKAIDLMKQNDDDHQPNYSYYDVLVRNKAISSEIEKNQILRETLLSQIKTEDFTAQEMRKGLPVIIKKPKVLKKFQKGEVVLKDAYDRASISGAQQRLKKALENMDDIEKDHITALDTNEVRAIQQVVKKIGRQVDRLSRMIDEKLS